MSDLLLMVELALALDSDLDLAGLPDSGLEAPAGLVLVSGRGTDPARAEISISPFRKNPNTSRANCVQIDKDSDRLSLPSGLYLASVGGWGHRSDSRSNTSRC